MCLIVDTNCYGDYCNGHEDMVPIRNWVENKKQQNRIAFSYTRRMTAELDKCKGMRKQVDEYARAGRLKRIPSDRVEQEKCELQKKFGQRFKSGEKDLDILALANVSNTKLLVTQDQNLIKDFKNSKIVKQGDVYQRKDHKRLLIKHICK